MREKTSKTDDKDSIYQLLDLSQLTRKKTDKSLDYPSKNLSSIELLQSRLACENELITIYARSTILNMLQVWSSNDSTIFPLEKFGDYSFLKFLDQEETNERIDRLIKSILQTEMRELSEHIHKDDWQGKAPLFNYLRKEIIVQLIQFSIKTIVDGSKCR